MPAEVPVSRAILNDDVVFILQHLLELNRQGRSMHMLDVGADMGAFITLEFGDYLKFLRVFAYVDVDREEHTLSVTHAGEQAIRQNDGQLDGRLGAHFADVLEAGVVVASPPRPPPPPSDAWRPSAQATDGPEALYQRGDVIGEGPLATVYAGLHTGLGLEVAVKQVREDAAGGNIGAGSKFAARLARETGNQAKLRHPGIVTVYDLDATATPPFAVLERCEGGNLRDQLGARNGHGLPLQHAMQAAGQLLSALGFIHENNLVHQGIKPENVLFDRFGNAKLGDLGFARLGADDDDTQSFIIDRSVVSYLAPELMQPDSQATPSSDVYAAGIILHEMLTGHIPGRRSPELSKVVEGVPRELDALFDRMVADRAEDRYTCAVEVVKAFHDALPDGRWGHPGLVCVRTVGDTDIDVSAIPA